MSPRLLVALLFAAGCGDDNSQPDFAAPAVDMAVPPEATVLAPAQTLTNCLAIDSTSVYWTDQEHAVDVPDAGTYSQVLSAPLGGGTPTVLATNADTPGCVVVDGDGAYYTSNGAVTRVALGGGATTTLGDNHVLPGARPHIAVSGHYVYWITDVYGSVDAYNGMNAIVRVPTGGGPVETVATDVIGDPGNIAADAASLYFSDQNGMYVRTLAGGTPTMFGTSTIHDNAFAVGATHLVLAEVSAISQGDLAVFKLDGSGRQVVSMKLGSALAIDDSGVYANLDGHLTRFTLDGKSATVLTIKPPRAIALDAGNIYFTDGANILKLAK